MLREKISDIFTLLNNTIMKRFSLLFGALALCALSASAEWSPAGDRIRTPWADEVNPKNVLPEYPRPIMQRADWLNLNGLWDYAVTQRGASRPTAFDG